MSVEHQRRPRVFLSYSRHSEAHHLLVWRFREFLREHGVDARMDIDGEEQPRDVPKWIAREFDEADHVLSLVSPEYRECFEGDAPRVSGNGVRHEGDLIRTALYSGGTPARDKYLAVVLPGLRRRGHPDGLHPGHPHLLRGRRLQRARGKASPALPPRRRLGAHAPRPGDRGSTRARWTGCCPHCGIRRPCWTFVVEARSSARVSRAPKAPSARRSARPSGCCGRRRR